MFSWKALALTGTVGAATALYYRAEVTKRRAARHEATSKSSGKARIGGPFTLVDSNGVPTTDVAFRGTFALFYFGFTFCPDVCPAELRKLATVVDNISKDYDDLLVPVFVSLDPQRDTVGAVRTYCEEFHPRLIGLTGTPQQVDAATKAYRVYMSRDDGAKVGDVHVDDASDDYLVDHSIIMYLVDPSGTFQTYYGQSKTADEIAADIKRRMQQYRW